MSTTRWYAGLSVIVLTALCASAGYSQDYPTKPVRIVTGAPGGGSDFGSRLIAQGISGSLGQPVIVDNRAGVIPNEVVAKAAPDGYTVLFTGQSMWVVPLLQASSWDPVKDFSPVAIATSAPNALA